MVRARTLFFCLSIPYSVLSFSLFKEAQENEDCYFLIQCASGLTCFDFRCQVATPNKTDEIHFTPEGPKCNWLHHCPKDYTCTNHRCQSSLTIVSATSSTSKQTTQNTNLRPEPHMKPNTSSPSKQGGTIAPPQPKRASQLAQEAPTKPINYYS